MWLWLGKGIFLEHKNSARFPKVARCCNCCPQLSARTSTRTNSLLVWESFQAHAVPTLEVKSSSEFDVSYRFRSIVACRKAEASPRTPILVDQDNRELWHKQKVCSWESWPPRVQHSALHERKASGLSCFRIINIDDSRRQHFDLLTDRLFSSSAVMVASQSSGRQHLCPTNLCSILIRGFAKSPIPLSSLLPSRAPRDRHHLNDWLA